MKTKLWKVIALLLILSLFGSACQRNTNDPAPVVSKFTEDMRLAYMNTAKAYAAHVVIDRKKSEIVANFMNLQNDVRAQVGDELFIMDQCYTNTQEFVVASLTGAFGEGGIGGQDEQPLLNVLALNETYNGDVAQCQEATNSVLIYTRGKRTEGTNLKNEYQRAQSAIVDLEMGDFKTAVIVEFYNKYGPDMAQLIQDGDAAFASFVGSQSEDARLPARFIGFPTGALQVLGVRDMKLCEGYLKYFEGTIPAPSGTYPSQWQVSIDVVAGNCNLYQMAAQSYMTLVMSASAAVQSDLQEGCTSFTGECQEPQK